MSKSSKRFIGAIGCKKCKYSHKKTKANDRTFTMCPTCCDMVVRCRNFSTCSSIANEKTVTTKPLDQILNPHDHWVYDNFYSSIKHWTCKKCYKIRCQTNGNNFYDVVDRSVVIVIDTDSDLSEEEDLADFVVDDAEPLVYEFVRRKRKRRIVESSDDDVELNANQKRPKIIDLTT